MFGVDRHTMSEDRFASEPTRNSDQDDAWNRQEKEWYGADDSHKKCVEGNPILPNKIAGSESNAVNSRLSRQTQEGEDPLG